MKVAVVGGGGREHALVRKLHESPSVESLYAFPGSEAMSDLARCIPLSVTDLTGITDFAVKEGIDLLVVGPEVPLTQGLADAAEAKGIAVFGPVKAAARLEGSKGFAKDLMKKYGVPTAAYEIFTDKEAAKAYIEKQGAPIVIKADGLAAGKGVVVAQTVKDATDAVDAMMKERIFGESGGQIVVEECMVGEEASLLAFVDGKTIVPMVAAQDHKRIFDGDKGPNTGGMGAYAPAPVLTDRWRQVVEEKILRPVVDGLAKEGVPYKGCLYAGLMLTDKGPKVVEFNCRFGDPETQAVLPLMQSELLDAVQAALDRRLDDNAFRWQDAHACCVVAASAGYPGEFRTGLPITGLERARFHGLVFIAGAKQECGEMQTSGGRVLNCVGVAPTASEAQQQAYDAIAQVQFDGITWRRDIGQ